MRALALAVALLPSLVAAQDLAQAGEDCRELINTRLTEITALEVYAMIQAKPDGWCEATQLALRLPVPDYVSIHIDSLRWRSEGLLDYARALAEGRGDLPPPPSRLEVEIEGAWLYRQVDDPMLNWLLITQSVPDRTDGTISLAATEGAGLELRVDLDIPHGNVIRAKALVEGVDLSSHAAMQASLGRAGLTELSVAITTRDLFETRILPAFAPILLGDATNPEEMVRRQKALADVQIRRLPVEVFSDRTPDELRELLGELPNPSGTLSVDLVAEEGGGLGLPRFSRFVMTGLPDSLQDLWPALDGVTITADWAPATD